MACFAGCKGGDDCHCEEKRYWGVLALAVVIFLVEILGGWWVGSLALQSDAFHVLIDAVSIFLGIITVYAVKGHNGDEEAKIRSISGDISAVLLMVAAVWILKEAYERMYHPVEILSGYMIAISFAGGLGNYLQHLRLESGGHEDHSHHDEHITHRAMSLHVLSDLMQSVAVVAGGVVIFFTGYTIVDPILSVFVALYMFYGAANIFKISHQSRK